MDPWITVAPIYRYWPGADFQITTPIDLGNGVFLTPIPDWVKGPEMTPYLHESERQEHVQNAPLAFTTAYEAASLGDPDPRVLAQQPVSKQDTAMERIRVANLALWLAHPSSARFHLSFDFRSDHGKWIHRRTSRHGNPLLPHPADVENRLTRDDLAAAKALNEACAPLPASSTVWISARALWRALTETWWEGRYLTLWIALEALFGPAQAAETTYRLCQRLALFLDGGGRRGQETFGHAKGGYVWRSKVVHGLRLQKLKPAESERFMYQTERWIRAALVKILGSVDLIASFSDHHRREALLDDLVFGVPPTGEL